MTDSCAIRGRGRAREATLISRPFRAASTRLLLCVAIGYMATRNVTASAAPHASVLQAEAVRVETMAKARSTALAVFGDAASGGGSAVVISPDGYALSNFHVTKPAGNAMKCGMADGQLYDAVIVGIDPTGDVALIKLMGREDFPFAELGDSDALRAGDWAFVVGNPFLLANDFKPTVTYGLISGVHRYQYPSGTLLEYADCIQTDAAINPGNSGGPLFNSQGQLVGIVGRGSFEKRGRVNVGVGYAISINQIKHFMGYLKSGRVVDHATLGATVSSDEEGHAVVDDIQEFSDVYRRGLRYDDEIVRFAGRDITTVNALKNVLGIYPRGWRLPLTFRREGETFDCLVRLAGVHGSGQLAKLLERGPPELPGPKPERQPNKKPDHPDGPLPHPALPKSSKMPEIAANHFERKRGFANYFFNRLNQDRVWKAHAMQSDCSDLSKQWTIQGELEDADEVIIHLSEDQGTIRMPEGESTASFDGLMTDALKPPTSGGLLAALHIWQRLLMKGPERFGDVYYLGTMPIRTSPRPVDVLHGTYGGVESQFYFDPQAGHLVGMEMFPDDDVDPCEVYFADFQQIDGRALPHRLEVHFGDRVFAVVHIKEFKFEEPPPRL